MIAGGRSLLILGAAALLMASCATVRREEAGGAVASPAAQATESTEPLHPEPTPAEQPAAAPTTEPAANAQASATTFVATEDLYKKTFDEVNEAVATLTKIIAAGDYDRWVASLTADYVRVTSSPEFLREASDAQVLKKDGVVLRTLRDYFEKVVVPSRVQATLEEITFVDATHVKAITRMQSRRIILYYLVCEDDQWKVGILPDGEK